ncbi:MAG: Asp-tRNA(Asn)/Glu-tRNA(Gln) amidotransferase subunit GatB, partial [Phascolarctobacterium sp.]|nr:Asp-tRNA(Asn)/Glu-tRNA(Gln) amidotransferase subunit GatB [Phascolarctobacterium sp.]
FYPDLCTNYQISQLDKPICLAGHIDINVDGEEKRIGVTRIHMEQDAGKLVHSGATISTSDYSGVDYNRAGVALIEIVSEPDMRSAEEARAYLENLKAILEYTDVCDCKMQEGSLRCDANVSIMPEGATEFGTRIEIKNLNSFRALVRAIDYEVQRQKEVLEDGGRLIQETRTWDDANGVTLSMRNKETAEDYRYFPDADLVPVIIDDAWIERVRAELPELPAQRQARLMEQFGLPKYDASIIVSTKAMAEYFDEAVKTAKDAKGVSNWLLGDVSAYLNNEGISISEFKVSPANLAELVNLTKEGVLSSKLAKKVFTEMLKEDKSPKALVKELGLEQVSDEGAIMQFVEEAIAENPQSVADFKAGKDRAIGFLVGQIMKKSKGKANPGMVQKMLKEKLQ